MNEELRIIIKAINDAAIKAIKQVSNELKNMSKSANSASKQMKSAFTGITKAAAIVVGAIVAIGAAMVNLGKKTLHFQQEQARLVTAFQATGASAEVAAEAYKNLYRFLGNSARASEAAAHLAKITTNQESLAEWTSIAQGVYATFGDSLPIEGLTEAANETIRVGQVTGVMADALNWAGVSEDAFNEALAQCVSLSEREALLRNTLNGLYRNASQLYERNNQAMLEYNESQANMEISMTNAGRAMMPLMTALNNLGTAFFDAITPALNAVIPAIAGFVDMITAAINAVVAFFAALTGSEMKVSSFGEVMGGGGGAAANMGAAADSVEEIEDGMAGASGSAKELKRTLMGFDELNVVTDPNKSSGGGGSGSNGAGGGGDLGGGSANFEAVVEEGEAKSNKLVDRLKQIFGELKDILATTFAPSIDAWKDAIAQIADAWNQAKPDFIHGAEEILDAFMTLGDYIFTEFVPNIINAFSVNFAPIFADVISFALIEAGEWFSWFGELVNDITNDMIIPALKLIENITVDTFNIIGSVWENFSAPLIEELDLALESIRNFFTEIYNNVILPIWDTVVGTLQKIWDEGLAPLVERILEFVMVFGTSLLALYNEYIAPFVEWLATNILPPIVNFVNRVIEIVGDIVIDIAQAVEGIIQVLEGIIQFVTGVFTGDWETAWEGIKNIWEGFWDAVGNIAEGALRILWSIVVAAHDLIEAAVLAFVEVVKGLWNAFWTACKNIWQTGVDAVCALVEWFVDDVIGWFTDLWDELVGHSIVPDMVDAIIEWFQTMVDDVVKMVKDFVKKVIDFFKNLATQAGEWFAKMWELIKKPFLGTAEWFKTTFQKAYTNITNIFDKIGTYFAGLWDKIKTTFSSLGTSIANAISGAVRNGLNGVINMIENTINSAINLINGAIRLANMLPGVSVGSLGHISLPRLARGGIVDAATIAMIGERGKEAVVPLENNTEWMDVLAERIAARNGAPSRIVLEVDGRELGYASIKNINAITAQTGRLQLTLA